MPPPNGDQPLPPPLLINTGVSGDKCVIQIMTTMIVDPGFMRQLARQFADTADQAERAIVLVGPGKLVVPG
jgi:hypothetical protein